MLVFGFLGEAGLLDATLGFVIGMAGWIYIIYEVFSGEASKLAAGSGNKGGIVCFQYIKTNSNCWVGIYPIGYFLGYLGGGTDANTVNIIYNVADLVNKTAFGLAIWAGAKMDSENG